MALTTTAQLRLLNLGCGRRFHTDWTNLDLHPCDPAVAPWDVHQPLPFADGSFDTVYHSHLLEHLPADCALGFLRECRRVLTPGGIMRIAVPDLEAIVQLYLKAIHEAWDGNRESMRNHRWLVTELYDQTTRETPGGTIAKQANGQEPFSTLAWYRLGEDGAILRQSVERKSAPPTWRDRLRGWVFGSWHERIIRWLLGDEYALLQVGRFRRSGEIHHWMYDRVSLRTLLHQAGFGNFRCVSANESAINGWTSYHLDTLADGRIRKPDSIYVEAQA
ncbi:MAG: methyltransferase domain-containing protein [Gemmataceae bacterium]|nr:methyltransferase domain-containing protein [Gemmataceae bacterium]